jgi:endoribonuclease L-PSP, putative
MATPVLINTENAPGAVGPYSQALAGNGLIFTSGQLPLDPKTKTMPEDIKEQAAMALTNLKNILEAGGSGMDKILKTTVFLTDINDFASVNEIYATFFGKPFPARSCFAVKDLPLGARVEIEAVALA